MYGVNGTLAHMAESGVLALLHMRRMRRMRAHTRKVNRMDGLHFDPRGDVKVFIQQQDGTVFEMTASIVSLDIQSLPTTRLFLATSGRYCRHEPTTFMNIHLSGTGLTVYQQGEAVESVTRRRSALEWLCDFCGSPNTREHTHCTQCSAARSFVYD